MHTINVNAITLDKAQVVAIATRLSIDIDAVLGKLLRVWLWASQNQAYERDVAVSPAFIDRLTFQSGFATAMQTVGWLQVVADGIRFPHFDEHNGPLARQRAATKARVQRHRAKSAAPAPPPGCNTSTVTNVRIPNRNRTGSVMPP